MATPAPKLPRTPVAQLRLMSPDLYTNILQNKPLVITWESLGNTQGAAVRIDLYQDTPNGPQFLLNITPATPDVGQYDWIPADSGINYGTYGLRIMISLVGSPNVFDRSTETSTVPENGNTFYVNDATVNPGDLTTAPGSNRNDGMLPSAHSIPEQHPAHLHPGAHRYPRD